VEGPVRSILKLRYKNLTLPAKAVVNQASDKEDVQIDLEQRIEIWAGQHAYQSTVSVANIDARVNIAVGIVNFHDAQMNFELNETHSLIHSFGEQAEASTNLGMAIYSPSQNNATHTGFATVGTSDIGIEQSFLSTFEVSKNSPLNYRFYAVWQPRMTHVSSSEAFVQVIEQDALKERSVSLSVE
jgi:hypothetical protein